MQLNGAVCRQLMDRYGYRFGGVDSGRMNETKRFSHKYISREQTNEQFAIRLFQSVNRLFVRLCANARSKKRRKKKLARTRYGTKYI